MAPAVLSVIRKLAGFVDGTWKPFAAASADDTSYDLGGLKSGRNYKVAVIAKTDGNWDKDFSKAITVTPKAAAYPVVKSQVKDDQFRLAWTASEGAEAYAVAVYQNGWKLLKKCSADTLTYTSAKLTSGTYHIAVAAKVNGRWDNTDIRSRAVTITIK